MSEINTAERSQQVSKITFAVGGNVFAKKGFYVSRKTDAELLSHCRDANFAYVLAPRQLGKTSLVIRTSKLLREENILSVIIDLSPIGKKTTIEQQWYLSLLGDVIDQLDLDVDLDAWWAQHASRGASKALILFFREVLLKQVEQQVVIFLDEIDSTINLEFKDDFFAALRYIYNARGVLPAFQRLSFVLIGVATPNDLISDPYRTPFNVGHRVDLSDFTLEEAAPLADGLGLPEAEGLRVLDWVFRWTMGHPYLTMRISRLIVESERGNWSQREVNELVAETFFGKIDKDLNLQFVRDMLTVRVPPEIPLGEVLTTFKSLRRQPINDDKRSLVLSHLKLSGVAREDGNRVRVRNPIYKEVFDDKWIKDHLPETWAKQQYQRVRRVAFALLLIIILLGSLLAMAWYERNRAEREKNRAESALQEANAQKTRAEAALSLADKLRLEAENQQALAERGQEVAEKAQETAETKQAEAERARAAADEQRSKAQAALQREGRAKERENDYRDGVDLYLTNDLVGAGKKFVAALEHTDGNSREERLRKAKTLRNIGGTNAATSTTDEALFYYNRALKIFEEEKDSKGVADTLLGIAKLQSRRDEKAKATDSYKQALQLYRDAGDKAGEANTHRAMAELIYPRYSLLDEKSVTTPSWVEAENHYNEALKDYRELGDKTSEARVLSTLVDILRSVGADEKEKKESKQKAAGLEAELLILNRGQGDRSGEADALDVLSSLYQDLGDTPKSIDYYIQSLNVANETTSSSTERRFLNLPAFYSKMSDAQKKQSRDSLDALVTRYEQRKDKLNEAHALGPSEARALSLNEARALSTLGRLYASEGKTPEAVKYYERALEASRLAGNKTGEGDVYRNIGKVYYISDDKQKALQYFQQALKAYQNAKPQGGKPTERELSLLKVLGEIYYLVGDKKNALETFKLLFQQSEGRGDRYNTYRTPTVRIISHLSSELGGNQPSEDFLYSTLEQYEKSGKLDLARSLLIETAYYNIMAGKQTDALNYIDHLAKSYEANLDASLFDSDDMAYIYAFARERQKALDVLDAAYKQLLPLKTLKTSDTDAPFSDTLLMFRLARIADLLELLDERDKSFDFNLRVYSLSSPSYDDYTVDDSIDR